jgi:hypothetical protein
VLHPGTESRFVTWREQSAELLVDLRHFAGWATIRLTFDRYGHLFPGLDERLRDGLEAGFRAAQQDPAPPPAEVRSLRP